jgi:hypothetical protein
MIQIRLRTALLSVWLCVACALTSPAVFAQNAAELDKKAREAFNRGDFEVAARTFEEAYRLKPHPATQYNAALAWEKAGELARAADAFESALDSAGLDDGRATASRERLAVLKRQLGYLFVTKPIGATATIAHAEAIPIPAKVHLSPGKYELAVRRNDGTTATKSVSIRAGEAVEVAVEGGGGLDTSPVGSPEEEQPKAPDTPPDENRQQGTCTQCTWGWVAIGAAVAAAGAGTYFGLKTLSENDKFEDSNREDDTAHDRAVTARTMSNVFFGVAIVSGAVGVVLLLTGKSSTETESAQRKAATRTELHVGPTGVSASIHF